MAAKLTVELSWISGLYLIVEWPTGVVYQHQVGGEDAIRAQLEGFLVLLFESDSRPESKVPLNHFNSESRPLIERDADVVDEILREGTKEFVRVDRARLLESSTSWIYILINESDLDAPMRLIDEVAEYKVVLTWENDFFWCHWMNRSDL